MVSGFGVSLRAGVAGFAVEVLMDRLLAVKEGAQALRASRVSLTCRNEDSVHKKRHFLALKIQFYAIDGLKRDNFDGIALECETDLALTKPQGIFAKNLVAPAMKRRDISFARGKRIQICRGGDQLGGDA